MPYSDYGPEGVKQHYIVPTFPMIACPIILAPLIMFYPPITLHRLAVQGQFMREDWSFNI